MNTNRPPRILVADDDPVSLRFLVAALEQLGCTVSGVTSGSETLLACERVTPDLLLLDRRMPDLGGAPLLLALRRAGCNAPAIATSAELDATARAELAAAGYIAAVTKPIGVEQLAVLIGSRLPQLGGLRRGGAVDATTGAFAPVVRAALLEDRAALASVGGDQQTLLALRGLFLRELEAMSPRIAALGADELGEWLHRLRASCRYCGAARLLEVAERLERELKLSGNVALGELVEAISATITALGNG